MDLPVELPEDLSNFRVHITGIKGTGSAALAEIFHARGAVITGSDVADEFYTDAILKKIGVRAKPFDADNVADCSLVVYAAAYNPDTHPELAAAKKRNIACISYPRALGLLSKKSISAGIAGVHGKTTTAGLAGTLLKELGFSATALAGSIIASFGTDENAAPSCVMLGGGKYFVAETCEYKKNFLNFYPAIIALTSVESDHQDCFPQFKDIQDAFVEYIMRLPPHGTLIYCADDLGAKETVCLAARQRGDLNLVPYGESLDAGAAFKIVFLRITDGRQYFRVGGFDTEFSLALPGKHLALNAACAIAVCFELAQKDGMARDEFFSPACAQKIQKALSRFTGAKRRSEITGAIASKNADTIFIDDYAHHPTAITKTLEGYREFFYGRRLIVDFMPHTFSRTSALLSEFAAAFDCADAVILHKIYASARETPDKSTVTGKTLFAEIQNRHKYTEKTVLYTDEPLDALDAARAMLLDGRNLFVTMGAGDNWKLGYALYERLARED
jgi:UDP-N-acetylmuramate--alanine ligase